MGAERHTHTKEAAPTNRVGAERDRDTRDHRHPEKEDEDTAIQQQKSTLFNRRYLTLSGTPDTQRQAAHSLHTRWQLGTHTEVAGHRSPEGQGVTHSGTAP